ncbi:unnamed protein product [Staurois parvus]|uniref:Uncharacterized protein n=1 Tax=Staurois parvus TaxID=386267 RepID=A0ABN9BCG6_9NEOB|nr:unnamed protein product [Staurois parvus]
MAGLFTDLTKMRAKHVVPATGLFLMRLQLLSLHIVVTSSRTLGRG